MATTYKPAPLFPAFPKVTTAKSGKNAIPHEFENVMVFDPAFLRQGTSYIAGGARNDTPFLFGVTGKKEEGILYYIMVLPARMVKVPATVSPTFTSWAATEEPDAEEGAEEGATEEPDADTDTEPEPDAE